MTKKNPFKLNANEIKWNLINSFLAGALVLFGSLSSGELTLRGIYLAFIASLIIACSKFKEYWTSQQSEYLNKMFTFIH